MTRLLRTLIWLATAMLAVSANADSSSLRAQAQADDPSRYAFAVAKGAEFKNTSDNKSFTVWWVPAGTPKGVIVALHGHDSFATDEIYLWQPYAEKYGYALLALQWWFGAGESTSDYYTPDEMYPILASRLAEKNVKTGSVMFIGFSRGSANSYAVAALDAAGPAAKRYFGFVFSNSGGAVFNYPPTKAVDSGTYGSQPYAGLPWGMYCGEKDDDPQMSGCPAMSTSRDWVSRLGANMVLYIEDPTGDHGGFMTNSANVESALATYAQLLSGSSTAPRCSLSTSSASVTAGASVTLTASCTPAATAYAWTGGNCVGTSTASCTTTPSATTTYTVSGSNSAGWGSVASATVTVNPAVDTTQPSVPAGLRAAIIEPTAIGLSWNAATDNVAVTGYRVYRNGALIGSPSGTSYSDSALSPSTAFVYTVAACDAAGNCSASSASLRVSTSAKPAPPACSLSASASTISPGASVTLTASCNPAATAFVWTGGACAGTTASSCTVSPSATTTYTVIGSNAGGPGTAGSVTVTVSDTTAPTVPANLAASAVSATAVSLSWSAASDNVAVSGYRLYRNGILVATPSGTSANDSGLAAATAYGYMVAACDAAGNCSAPSAAVNVSTPAQSSSFGNTEADCLFNWGEDSYPSLFVPRRSASLTASPYYFRRYASSNTYLGVSSVDGHLYYIDSAGRSYDLGLAATWSTQARCR